MVDCSTRSPASPHARPAPRKAKSKKKRGGQPGHERHQRSLIPIDQCEDVRRLKPTACRRCGGKLSGSDPEPLRHQVWELPEIRPLVTEYQRHRLACRSCGETTCAELPEGVPQGQDANRHRDLPPTTSKRLQLSYRRPPSPIRRPTRSLTPPQGVNGYAPNQSTSVVNRLEP